MDLMRIIPKNEFLNDDIQRILRYLKQKSDSITERDYVDAVDLAGHTS